MSVTFGLALDFWSTTKPLHTVLEDYARSPEICLHSIRTYQEEAGVNQVNLRVSMANMPRELAARTVALLGERVLPHV